MNPLFIITVIQSSTDEIMVYYTDNGESLHRMSDTLRKTRYITDINIGTSVHYAGGHGESVRPDITGKTSMGQHGKRVLPPGPWAGSYRE